jgi:hypothetical protein
MKIKYLLAKEQAKLLERGEAATTKNNTKRRQKNTTEK